MANNLVASGKTMNVTLGSGDTGYSSGLPIVVGSVVGVIQSITREGETVFSNQASAENDECVVALEGVFEVTKEAPLVIAQGDAIYWDAAAGEADKTDTNDFMGYAYEGAVSDATTVKVRLSQA